MLSVQTEKLKNRRENDCRKREGIAFLKEKKDRFDLVREASKLDVKKEVNFMLLQKRRIFSTRIQEKERKRERTQSNGKRNEDTPFLLGDKINEKEKETRQ